MKEDEEEERSSDISGYHSETDSAIMMTGNSPFVSKNARTNFLQRSGQFHSMIYRSCGVCTSISANAPTAKSQYAASKISTLQSRKKNMLRLLTPICLNVGAWLNYVGATLEHNFGL